jgi:hypothetical protein
MARRRVFGDGDKERLLLHTLRERTIWRGNNMIAAIYAPLVKRRPVVSSWRSRCGTAPSLPSN